MLLLHPPARTYSQKEKWWHKRSWQGQTCFPCNNWLYAKFISCWNSPFVVNTHKHCGINHRCRSKQNLGGCEGFLTEFSKTCLKKTPKKWPPKKPLYVLLGAMFFKSKYMGSTFTLAPPPSLPVTSMPWINQKRTFYACLDSTPNILNDETWGRWLCLDAGYENEALIIPSCRKASVSLQLSHGI